MIALRATLIAACLMCGAGATALAAEGSAAIEQAGDKVTCCNPEAHGFDSGALAELTEWIRDRRIPIFSVLVSRNGELAYELYTSSATRDHAHYLMSATKSVVSALVGIAIDRHQIGGPEVPITDILPRPLFASDADVARFKSVTIRDVMGMSALDALDPPRSYSPEAKERQRHFWADRSRVALALQQPLLPHPGRSYQYNDLNPQLVTGVLQYATGQSAFQYAEEHLFKPMAFRNEEWMHQDRSGVDNGGYGLRLRPIDMQKFGLLYMNGGVWRGQRLISEGWVKESFRSWIRTAPNLQQPDYGWFWWAYNGGPPGWTGHMANGWKGQRIAVIPWHKAVVTMTACIQDGTERQVFDQVVARVARASRGSGPVAADPANQARLNALLEQVRTGYKADCAGGEARMVPSIAHKEQQRVAFKPDVRTESAGQGAAGLPR